MTIYQYFLTTKQIKCLAIIYIWNQETSSFALSGPEVACLKSDKTTQQPYIFRIRRLYFITPYTCQTRSIIFMNIEIRKSPSSHTLLESGDQLLSITRSSLGKDFTIIIILFFPAKLRTKTARHISMWSTSMFRTNNSYLRNHFGKFVVTKLSVRTPEIQKTLLLPNLENCQSYKKLFVY